MPPFAVSPVEPEIPSTKPFVDTMPPELVRLPSWIVPPARLTLLTVCAKPPRSSVPPLLTVVALAALKAFAAPPATVAVLLIVVAPV